MLAENPFFRPIKLNSGFHYLAELWGGRFGMIVQIHFELKPHGPGFVRLADSRLYDEYLARTVKRKNTCLRFVRSFQKWICYA